MSGHLVIPVYQILAGYDRLSARLCTGVQNLKYERIPESWDMHETNQKCQVVHVVGINTRVILFKGEINILRKYTIVYRAIELCQAKKPRSCLVTKITE